MLNIFYSAGTVYNDKLMDRKSEKLKNCREIDFFRALRQKKIHTFVVTRK